MRKIVITFGRMNPPTVGHQKLVQKIQSVAKANNADSRIYLSHTQNNKKDPLTYDEKIGLARAAFGNIVVKSNAKTIIEVSKELEASGYTDLILVVGSDRIAEFERLLNKYNGKEYNFKSIKVVSAGERDPDAEGVEGMSASKLRKLAQAGDYETFSTGLPSKVSDKMKKQTYDKIRSVIKEENETDYCFECKEDPCACAGMQIGEDRKPLTIQQRMQRSRTLKRLQPKLQRFKKMRAKRMADEPRLKKKAQKAAIAVMRKKVAGERGKDYANLPASDKIAIDRLISKKSSMIQRLAKRLLPAIRKKELARVKQARSSTNEVYEVAQDKTIGDKPGTQPKKYYSGLSKSEKETRNAQFKSGAEKDSSDPSAYPDKHAGDAGVKTKQSKHTKKYKDMFGEKTEVSKAREAIQAEKESDKKKFDSLLDRARSTDSRRKNMKSTVEEFEINESAEASLRKKADKSGISYGTLKKVYDRGMAAWRTGHRPGATQQQWAFARVNSYITKGKGTYHGADKDLREEEVAEASDISGLTTAAKMVNDYIVTAEVDGKVKKFRVRGMTGPNAAKERFMRHASMAKVKDVKLAEEIKEEIDDLEESTGVDRPFSGHEYGRKDGMLMDTGNKVRKNSKLAAGVKRLYVHHGAKLNIIAITNDGKMVEIVKGIPDSFTGRVNAFNDIATLANYYGLKPVKPGDKYTEFTPSEVKEENVAEETIHVGYRNSRGVWIKTSTHSNYPDADKAMKELEKSGKKGVQHRYDNKGNIDPGMRKLAHEEVELDEESEYAAVAHMAGLRHGREGAGNNMERHKKEWGSDFKHYNAGFLKGRNQRDKTNKAFGQGSGKKKSNEETVTEDTLAEAEKNPHTSALGKSLYRDLSKEKKASPQQVQRNKERWAKRQAEREQGVAEGLTDVVKGIKRKVAGKEDPEQALNRRYQDTVKANLANNDVSKSYKRYYKIRKLVRKEEGGAGEWGTTKLTKKLKKDTPMEDTGNLTSKMFSKFRKEKQHTKKGDAFEEVVIEETETCCDDCDKYFDHIVEEAEHQGRKVKLNDPFRTPSGPKKFSVYVKNDKGNVVKVNFGDPNMEIKRDDPDRRKNFRARHNCENPGPKWKARYWSCHQWRSGAKVDS